MKNPFKGGLRRHHRHGEHGHHRGGGRGGHGRLFDYGGLRVVMLAMLAEQPRHGYEFIKLIEERSGGSYSPSPGVIYPTLAWLEDMGYARSEAEDGGRKSFSITKEGKAFLTANRTSADELMSRLAPTEERGRGRGIPSPIVGAMQNLKVAMRVRIRGGPITQDAAEKIAAALDTAAKVIERS